MGRVLSSPLLDELVRPHFPALQRHVGGVPVAYFDGPGGSQVPHAVASAMAAYLLRHNANTHGEFATSGETDRILAHARTRMADFLGATSAREIVFGANMTTITYAMSRALARTWQAGDEILVTDLDHQANIAPWRQAAAERGVIVHTVPFRVETMQLDVEALQAMLGARTRLVAVGYASNAVGTVNPVQQIAEWARAVGALTYVDAVHYAPHCAIDVGALGCDFLACSAYKFFGPHQGILWAREDLLQSLEPYKLPPAANQGPERWETGTQNHEAIAGIAAVVDWLQSLVREEEGQGTESSLRTAMKRIDEHESALLAHLLDGLEQIAGVRVYGPPRGAPRTPTVGFTLEQHDPRTVAAELGRQGLYVWNGDFYASTVVERLGLTATGGLIRVGMAPYCTHADVARLLEAVEAISGGTPGG